MQNKITDFISFQYPVFLSFLLYFFIDFNELRFSVVSSLSTMDSTKAEEAKLFLFTQDNAQFSSPLLLLYGKNIDIPGVCPVSPMVKENIGDRVLKRLEQEKVMPSGV